MKYYTPSIEEFHVGFEFQVKTSTGMWISSAANNLSMIRDIVETFESKEIRVKYLDKEDIDSLGWLGVIPGNVVDKDQYNVTHWVTDKYKDSFQLLQYYYPIGGHAYYISFGNPEKDKPLFEGIVKNKSELKRLMKQLNIEICQEVQ